MTSFFPDLNLWLALPVAGHRNSTEAWRWLNLPPQDTGLIFCRYTQIGMLNQSVMREQTLTLRKAWRNVFQRFSKRRAFPE
jgi:hypothetical protein